MIMSIAKLRQETAGMRRSIEQEEEILEMFLVNLSPYCYVSAFIFKQTSRKDAQSADSPLNNGEASDLSKLPSRSALANAG